MARRTRGFVQLEWVCPNCNTRNPGPKKSCVNCGAPQPDNVQFQRAAEEQLVTDPGAVAAAEAGADFMCPYCGTRNSGSAKICVQCGGDLVGARQRAAGAELEANTGPAQVNCTNCGTPNPSGRANCLKCGAPLPRTGQANGIVAVASATAGTKPKQSRWWMWAGLAAGLVICAAAVGLFVLPSATVEATVADVHWQTSVPVQEMQPRHYSNESGTPPGGAYDVSCHDESHDVCQERTIDKGNGYGEVVEDCQTETQQYCSYTVDEWETIQTYALEGSSYSPEFAQPSISAGQRLGDEQLDLSVVFNTEKGQKSYSPSSTDEFAQYAVGSTWTLSLNAVGGVLDVKR